MTNLLCPHCDQENQPGAKYCRHCGAILRWLNERYIIGVVPAEPNQPPLYAAADLWLCRACGELVEPANQPATCPHCQDNPLRPMQCQAEKHPLPPVPEALNHTEQVITWVYDELESGWFKILQPMQPVNHFPQGLQLVIGAVSDLGQRANNEDALLVHHTWRVYENKFYTAAILAVADGMGGHNAGEVASRAALDSLLLTLNVSNRPETAAELKQFVAQAVQSVNQQLLDITRRQGLDDVGATLTAAIISTGMAIIANVGDSRTYLFRNGALQSLTKDHSRVYRLFEQGKIGYDDIYTHPERNGIYSYLGKSSAQLVVDTFAVPLLPNDRLLLCTDGLWEVIRDQELAEVLQTASHPQTAAEALIARANAANGDDNISAIVAHILPDSQKKG